MLLVGRKQVTREEIMAIFAPAANLKDIEKKPSFEAHKSRRKIDRANGGVIKTPIGHQIRSHFMARHPQTGMQVEIRYALSHRPSQVGNSLMDVYEPRYVEFKGAKEAFQNDLDKAIYLYLHPTNASSPFKGTQKPKIEYIDTKKRAKDKHDTIDAVTSALTHADKLDDGQLIILAKGLGIKGVDKMEPMEVRAEVKQYAYQFPKAYNEKAFTQLTYIEGKILHLVDKGVFKLNTIGSVRRWTWTSGEKEGEVIVDIHNQSQDAKLALKNHIFSNMQQGNWLFVLDNIANTVNSKDLAERYLKTIEEENKVPVPADHVPVVTVGENLPDHLREFNNETQESETYVRPEWPTDFKSSMAYLKQFKKEGNPSNSAASQFLKAVESGEVDIDNARDFIKDRFNF